MAKNKNEDISRLEIVVGYVVDCKQHPDADGLYISKICIEKVDTNKEKDTTKWPTRTIVSGLAKFVKLEEMKDSKVMVLANLKTSKLRGVESEGMVLCASNADHTVVEVVRPPQDAPVGSILQFTSYSYDNVENELMNPKSKTYPKIMAGLKCNENGEAIYEGVNGINKWTVNGKPCKPKSLKNCPIA